MTFTYASLALLLQGSGNSMVGPIFMYGAIFAIFYFILIRPQQKQRKEHDALIRAVKRGDEIVTAGGIVGEVVHVRERPSEDGKGAPLEDLITIKSGDSRLVVERGRIAKITRSSGAPAAEG
jgi:preprotein translocase subunit YajC